MCHPLYLHKGRAKALLNLSRAKRRQSLLYRERNYWSERALHTPLNSRSACLAVLDHFISASRTVTAEVHQIERQIGVRK